MLGIAKHFLDNSDHFVALDQFFVSSTLQIGSLVLHASLKASGITSH